MGGRMQILRAAAYQRMAWKNGGGETLEIAVSPPQATFDTLDWRISMALVTQDGPFSMLAQIDRTLCVLDGPGLDLDFGADGGTQRVTAATAPFAFSADRPLHARILGGPITDLNVMTRRGRYRHAVRHLPVDPPHPFTSTADQLMVFCARGAVTVALGDDAGVRLDARDGVLMDDAATTGPIAVSAIDPQDAAVYLIELYRLSTQTA
jgi:environmental stress-induced protein Ves